jgi:N-acyl-D-amino-acid deacylase
MLKFLRDLLNALVGFLSDLANLLTGATRRPELTWTANSDPAAPSTDTEIDEMIREYMQQHAVKAGQFSLFVNGNLKMSTSYTLAEENYPITRPDSVMRVASCSKAFTTAAILDLMDPSVGSPLLKFDDKVFDILFPDKPCSSPVDSRVNDITVQHLLEHTGGWNYRSLPTAPLDWVFHLKQIGRNLHLDAATEKKDFARYILCNVILDFTPGTRPDVLFTPPGQPTKEMDTYSNIGYVLLGMIVDAKKSSFIDYLDGNILHPMGILDVAVGNTRRADALPNEVSYDSPGFGPDATLGPADERSAPLPYGGDGSRKEVMDSGGGLIMSANSLAKFITKRNVVVSALADPNNTNTIAQLKVRNRGFLARGGHMPGTEAKAASFQSKDGLKLYDMAVIFNKDDNSKEDPGDNSNDFGRLDRHLVNRITDVF